MKKLLIVLLALAIVGVFAVAEDAPAASVSIGAWGRAWVNPVASNGTDSIVSAGPGWAGNGARVSVEFKGNSENVGFDWNPGVSNSGLTAVCDQAKIWVKINPMFQVQLGHIQGDVLRGKLDDYGDILPVDGKDNIFQRFNPSNGILVDITPMDGVYLGAAMDAGPGTAVLAKDAYKSIQLGGGYVIPNVGHFRVQYIGETAPGSYGAYVMSDDLKAAYDAYIADPLNVDLALAYLAQYVKDFTGAKMNPKASGAVQAAFAYTGMEGLLIDAGFKFPLQSDDQMKFSVGASYSKDALSTYERVDTTFGGKDADKLTLDAAGQVFYALAAPLSVGVEVAFAGMSNVDTALDAKTIDVYPIAKLGYSNGYLKVGFDYKAGLDDQDPQYFLPIQMEYWF